MSWSTLVRDNQVVQIACHGYVWMMVTTLVWLSESVYDSWVMDANELQRIA